ncbi:DUF4116 domain-containing protein [Mycoplasma sp. CB776]
MKKIKNWTILSTTLSVPIFTVLSCSTDSKDSNNNRQKDKNDTPKLNNTEVPKPSKEDENKLKSAFEELLTKSKEEYEKHKLSNDKNDDNQKIIQSKFEMLKLINENPLFLQFASDELKSDIEIVKQAVIRNPESLKYANKIAVLHLLKVV